MPKIKITEVDNTSSGISGADNIVFMPCKIAAAASGGKTFGPKLFNSLKEFKDFVTQESGESGEEVFPVDQTHISFKMICGLLEAGLSVLVQGIEGTDVKTEVTWSNLKDKSLYDIKFITAGGFEHKTGTTTLTDDGTNAAMMEAAAGRGDAIALCDHPQELTTAATIKAYAGTPGANGKFGAMFAPWCKFGTDIFPGSYAYLKAFASSIKTNASWLAIAGVARGMIPGLTAPIVEFGSTDCDTLQSRATELDGAGDNEGLAINPICYIRPFGHMVWGNRTLVVNAGSLKASAFLNVRALVCEIKKVIFKAARNLTFEQNSDVTWMNFRALITPTLDTMLTGNGISGYKIIKEKTDKKGRIKASIRIVPIEAVEDFELSVVLEDGTATTAE